ncbi:glutaredoxin 3 [Hyphococcus sp. DH-69]|uniref:glutaredoxin 3 n=1 Tax=Hyphococcus formosus TaxID=3143534 RepID=UPI00398A9C1F
MNPVVVYTKPLCPYCTRALSLLEKKGAKVTDISAAYDKDKRAEMLSKSNGKTTYPQIFIGETHVGGYDELSALDRAGKLDPMLNA